MNFFSDANRDVFTVIFSMLGTNDLLNLRSCNKFLLLMVNAYTEQNRDIGKLLCTFESEFTGYQCISRKEFPDWEYCPRHYKYRNRLEDVQYCVACYKKDDCNPLGMMLAIVGLLEVARNDIDLGIKAATIITENFTYSEIFSETFMKEYMRELLGKLKQSVKGTCMWAKYLEWETGGMNTDENVYI
jgi:hypothetical protein